MTEHTTTSSEQTLAVGRALAKELHRGDVVALFGDLGSGKTHFVKGVCEAFQVKTPVTSPSFVVLNRYEGQDVAGAEILIHHLDLYRIRSAHEIYDLGYEEILSGDGICLIEWAEYLGELLPRRRREVRLTYGKEETTRHLRISEHDEVPA